MDELRFGLYKMGHHEHIFKPTDGGVMMEDIVTGVVPFGFFGRVVNRLVIEKNK